MSTFLPGSQPFGNLLKFGNVLFPGPSSPIDVPLKWSTSPTSLIDATFPADPFALHPAPMDAQKAKFTYGIIANCGNRELDLTQIESAWNVIYKGLRAHNNQSASLVVDTGLGNGTLAFCRARIDALSLKMADGHDTMSLMIDLQFTLLTDWKSQDGTVQFPATYNPDGTKPLGDISVPFGNLINFGNAKEGTYIFNSISTTNKKSSIFDKYDIQWFSAYSPIPHSVFPLDHYGVSPVAIKPIDVTYQLLFQGTYPEVYTQYNALLVQLRSNMPQHGLLVCTDSTGTVCTAPARISEYPLALKPINATYYIAQIVFTLLGDWYK